MEEKLARKRRVLLVPAPAQGHITPMIQLATILHLKGFSITIAQTKFNYFNPSNNLSDFQFVTIPENLPESDLKNLGPGRFMIKLAKECCFSFEKWLGLFLLQQQSINEEIACVIYDEFMYFVEAAVKEYKLPNVILSTTSATSFVCRFVMCKLYAKDGLAPLKEGGGREEELVPELYPIRYKDLPTSAFAPVDCSVELFKKTCYTGTASSMIINTVRCLEISSLEWLQQELEIPVYPIGPLHMVASVPPTSLLEENESCIGWLNKRKPSSVIYISLGSMSLMEIKEVFEMASGLVSSNQHFLWVIRPESIRDSKFSNDEELLRKMVTSDRGYIVKWAPQKQVLAHSAVGAFWSHCGWNSTLESLSEGVPMICRPFTTDQKGNARYLECVWKVGIQVEGELERGAVERAVKRLMVDEEGHEMKVRALSLKEKLKVSVSGEGSSHKSLDDFIRTL
ncbi:unnamed protein product [Arabis nemorensis]|uniref:Glycosyltransferase n=1 Tax=Arabis nemorensis TaxID=586526 RepID=A0A565C672_9BRAS|nr:unnamed protein product [Arabis nemorensis]